MATQTNTTDQLPILIIGGGPSGLAAALILAQNGVPVRIVDKATVFHKASRGSAIQPKTMEIYRFLGLSDDFRRVGCPMKTLRSYKLPEGTEPERTWGIFDTVKTSPDRPESLTVISQTVNERTFRVHLAKHGIFVEQGTEPTALEQDVDSGVSVVLKTLGTDGAVHVETVRASYVIGADGARGFTRSAIGATFEGRTKDEHGHVMADVQLEGLSRHYWHVWNMEGQYTILARYNDDNDSFTVAILGLNFDAIELYPDPTDTTKFVDFFYKHTRRTAVVFKEFLSFTYWKPRMRLASKFQEGRVFIVGDAAHIHSPTGGQGLNTSVQDSFNLGWKLALVQKKLASPQLLTTYQAERMPVVSLMIGITAGLYTHLESDKAVDGSKSGFIQWRNPALFMHDINYRWSPIVHDTRGTNDLSEDELKARAYTGYPGEDVRAGDRAPNAPGLVDALGTEIALFDIFKPYRHTILVFVPVLNDNSMKVAEDVIDLVQNGAARLVLTLVIARDVTTTEVPNASVYHDKEGVAHEIYHVGLELKIVVVRPDGYVGAFVDNVTGVQIYLSRVFNSHG